MKNKLEILEKYTKTQMAEGYPEGIITISYKNYINNNIFSMGYRTAI